MAEMFHQGSRALQDQFDTRRLADRIEEKLVSDTISPHDAAFIQAMDMFFIATADAEGRPNCSYKGGAPGFVRVLDEHTIAFPNCDGNGMYLSMGNVLENANVGILVHRLRSTPPDASEGCREHRPGRPADGPVSGGAVHRSGPGARGVPQLPSVHPPDAGGRAFGVRAAGRMRHAGPPVETGRVVQGLSAGGRSGERPEQPRAACMSERRRREGAITCRI
jgi:hypothetical protein